MKITAVQTARIAIFIIFLALIRSIGECFRLRSVEGDALAVDMLEPFLVSAMVCSVACLIMFLLYIFSVFRWISVLAVITIGVMIFLKIHYHV